MEIHQLFGIIAVVLNIINAGVYLYAAIRGNVRYERGAMIIWSVISVITFLSYRAEGANGSLLLAGSSAVLSIIFVFLSIKYGYGWVKRRDYIALALALLAMVLWYLSDDPTIALVLSLIADFMGLSLVFFKAKEAPDTESILAWSIFGLASIFAFLAIEEHSFEITIYPIYLIASSILIVGITKYARQKQLTQSSS